MALPPTIPTSFVPKQVMVTRKSTIGFNPFLLVSYVIFGVWVITAGLVFTYQWYLTRESSKKIEELKIEQTNIDQTSVNNFIRLRDRFAVAKQTLDKHVTLSEYFNTMEGITIQNARFTKLKLTVQENRTAKVEMNGTARNFNALAAQSTAFASDKNIKNAIFSGFVLDQKDGTVAFQINADIDPVLITQTAASASLTPTAPAGSEPAQAPAAPLESPTKP